MNLSQTDSLNCQRLKRFIAGAILVCDGLDEVQAARILGFRATARPPRADGLLDLPAQMQTWNAKNIVVISEADLRSRHRVSKLVDLLTMSGFSAHVVFPPKGYLNIKTWFATACMLGVLERIAEGGNCYE